MSLHRQFTFKIKTARGEVREGMVSAETPRAARAKLEADYGEVLALTEVVDRPLDVPEIPVNSVKNDELAVCTRQLSMLLRSGVTLPRAFELLAADASLYLSLTYTWLGTSLVRGESLSAGMRHFPTVFDQIQLALVRSGEMSGRLDTNLLRIADLLEARSGLRKKIVNSLTYPAVVAVVAFLVLCLFVVFVLPSMRPNYDDMGVQLPLITRVLLGFSDAASNPLSLLVLTGGVIGAWAYVRRLTSSRAARLSMEARARQIPLIGSLLEKQELVGVLYVVSSMLDSGVPLAETLIIAEQASLTSRMEAALHHVRARLLEGDSLTEAMNRTDVFPRAVLQIVEVGELSGTISFMMRSACRLYEQDIELRLATLTPLLEPLVMLMVGVMVGFVTLAAFLPSLSLATGQ
ncbi:MAG: type II secretion system F family protein [Proteobacteria bacterium]|nr:type II secretion system F family protein [Pseudomonadota bacterium]